MKVDIPKNLWIDQAEADFFREGFFRGVYGLTLHFTGGTPETTEIMSEILEPLTLVKLPRRKIVRFTGLYDPKDQFIPLAIEAFRSWGFEVQAVLNEAQVSLPWRQNLNWFIYQTTKPFIVVNSSELWYMPPETDDPIQEPRIPETSQALLYIAKGHSVTQTVRFITTAKYNWILL